MNRFKRPLLAFSHLMILLSVVLLVSGIRMEHPDPASKQSAKPVWHIPIAVYTVLDSRWCTENLSEKRRVLYQKQTWETSGSRWFSYKNTSRCAVLWMSNMRQFSFYQHILSWADYLTHGKIIWQAHLKMILLYGKANLYIEQLNSVQLISCVLTSWVDSKWPVTESSQQTQM